MSIYHIEIKETLSRIVPIKASSREKAEEKAIDGYQTCKYILDAEDYQGAEFNVKEKAA